MRREMDTLPVRGHIMPNIYSWERLLEKQRQLRESRLWEGLDVSLTHYSLELKSGVIDVTLPMLSSVALRTITSRPTFLQLRYIVKQPTSTMNSLRVLKLLYCYLVKLPSDLYWGCVVSRNTVDVCITEETGGLSLQFIPLP